MYSLETIISINSPANVAKSTRYARALNRRRGNSYPVAKAAKKK